MKWTDSEIEILQANYPLLGPKIQTLLPNRALTAIQKKASNLKIRKILDTSWSLEELNILESNYSTLGAVNLINNKLLLRTISAIETKASRLGLIYLNATNIKYTNESYDTELINRGILNSKRIGNYISHKLPIKFKCNKCEHEWTTQPNHILNGDSGCPHCGIWKSLSRNGIFPDILKLYVVCLDSAFIKVGITSKTWTKRLEEFKDKKLILQIRGTGQEIIKLEQSILEDKLLKRFNPENRFKGYTECFELQEHDNIIQRIENWKKTQVENLQET